MSSDFETCPVGTMQRLRELEAKVVEYDENITYLLDTTQQAVRDREGGGPENLLKSMCINWTDMRDKLGRHKPLTRGAILDAAVDVSAPAADLKALALSGVDPMNPTKGAHLPMIPGSWRFGFRERDDGVLQFGLSDDGPFVAWDSVKEHLEGAPMSDAELVEVRARHGLVDTMQQEFKLTAQQVRAEELARRYHEETEAFDRKVCTGPIIDGAIVPVTPEERATINGFALAVRRRIIAEAAQHGISAQEMAMEIARVGQRL